MTFGPVYNAAHGGRLGPVVFGVFDRPRDVYFGFRLDQTTE